MATIRLTSKRQATLPKALCDEMRLRPGDALRVTPRAVGGERVWCLEPLRRAEETWFGRLQKYARGKSHDMSDIRRSIEKARAHGRA